MIENGSSHWIVQGPSGAPRWSVSFPVGFTLTRVCGEVAVGYMRATDHSRVQTYRIASPEGA